MRFGETYMEYLHEDQDRFTDKFSHIEYQKLKEVLEICKTCKASHDSCETESEHEETQKPTYSQHCQCKSCSLCDQTFFSELMKEASDIAGCFNSRVKHLLHHHVATGMQRYLLRIRQCFKNDTQSMVEEGQMLIKYVTMNAIAICKILKKYDKVHCSTNGKDFKLKLQSEHIELLHSPWLIELGAFCLNFEVFDDAEFSDFAGHFSCNLDAAQPVISLTLPNSMNLEYDLTCAICLDIVFNPYALSCGHWFCKSCACAAASVMLFEGPKVASRDSKCPICREANVYAKAVHMLELDLLLKRRCKGYWKERHTAERTEMLKQTRALWELQGQYAVGY
ncbi:probable E3 ubiquitin-protein ligase BAH1-like [Tripterygium wilfordii]|uniref:probable E3 ubiquitin-protein ligase BAH1-like n=1 Tax=Tripterygium wilfordii TaxID=458696 RepID=UPI0018F7EA35|nr:probable E3 ubiquitin-protein ligase BAH1-like [Tripterygium wilfordii]XP_038690156.1 probable E3 ubiquitin-protein ligase BAH1-like [Tripterygium wilfordii]